MIEIQNRKANFNYFIESTIECGIVLTGTEIKSVRKGSANLSDSYARIKNSEVFLVNMFISTYDEGNRFNHDERRQRKLLLHKKEIYKIKDLVEKIGYSLVPIKLYFKNGKAKILLGIAKGKKTYDKRQAIKEKTIKKETEKLINKY